MSVIKLSTVSLNGKVVPLFIFSVFPFQVCVSNEFAYKIKFDNESVLTDLEVFDENKGTIEVHGNVRHG